jgi:hypothetical protein
MNFVELAQGKQEAEPAKIAKGKDP